MRKKIIYCVFVLLFMCAVNAKSQVTIGSQNDPHQGAVLDLQSTTKGLLLPKVSLSNVNILTVITSPTSAQKTSATGMVVYNTNASVTGGSGVGIYVWNGSQWAITSEAIPVPVSVTGVSLNKGATFLTIGGTEKLTATVAPSNATNKNVSWSSSNQSVATVSNGTITAVASGSVTITVTTEDGNKTATCSVTVAAANPDGSTTMRIGNNDYKTYNYNGTIWMVQNSKEGTSRNTGANGNYYLWSQAAQTNNACPSGWRAPSEEDWRALIPIVSADKSGVGKWWYDNSSYAGHYDENGTLLAYGSYAFWWSYNEFGCSTLNNGVWNGPYTNSGNRYNSFSVRCVKDWNN